jgi:hypothetical protein
MRFSIYHQDDKFLGNRDYRDILNDIKDGLYERTVKQIRIALRNGNLPLVKYLNEQIPGFTVSGSYIGPRISDNLRFINGAILLEVTKLHPNDFQRMKRLAMTAPFSIMAFVNVDATGINIIAAIHADTRNFMQESNRLVERYSRILDKVVRLVDGGLMAVCKFSSDRDALINDYPSLPNVELLTDKGRMVQFNREFDRLLLQIMKVHDLKDSSFYMVLASACNRHGIPLDALLNCIAKHTQLVWETATAAAKRIYEEKKSDFGWFARFAQFAQSASSNGPLLAISIPQAAKINEEEEDASTPFIPRKVYSSLPKLLVDVTKIMNGNREKDISLTGALTVLSAIFPMVRGLYNSDSVYSNLYSFVIAPPASSKGKFKYSKDLVMSVHDRMMAGEQIFSISTASEDTVEEDDDGQETIYTETEASKKPLLIPGNSSSAAVMMRLNANTGIGLIFETEADTLSGAMNQEWGDYSDLLRKAWAHETISINRKTNDELFEVRKPKLSVGLTGTPSQVKALIPSVDDGLFSRFCFYTFYGETAWKKVVTSRKGGLDLELYFKNLSENVLEICKRVNTLDRSFHWTTSMDNKLNKAFAQITIEVTLAYGDATASIIRRLGVMTYKISMLLTILRYSEKRGDIPQVLKCSMKDFNTAITLTKVYLEHGLSIYKQLPRDGSSKMDTTKKLLFDHLPTTDFSRNEAVVIGQGINIAERTVDKYLKVFLKDAFLKKVKYGKYSKSVE